MSEHKILLSLGIGILLFIFQNDISACSMYKITASGRTMVGCNEDNWRTTSRIWFQNASNPLEYGAAFTGSRKVGNERFAPQSGMNEAGLVFSRLASYFPKRDQSLADKKQISDEVEYLTGILHQCATVTEVKSYIEQFDHSVFIDDVFIYIDSSGSYLVVEPYTLMVGEESNYVLSNFCPSITDVASARRLERYRNGEDFLTRHKVEASWSFCRALSDTMHVCRARNGDGTLLTSIWDSGNGLVNLYFYHDFDSVKQFNIKEELAKGDHLLDVTGFFPVNAEFERLKNYRTPFNTAELRITLVFGGGIVLLLSLILLLIYRRRRSEKLYKIMLLMAGLNLLLFIYFFVLATNIGIYYFDAPYQDYSSRLISWSSYIPFIILLSLIPLIIYSIRLIKSIQGKIWERGLLVFNNLIFMVSIVCFAYWGLYDVLP